ncbi:Mce protein [Mycobacterium sp. OTB74]|jgi:Mce-associated membrane protein|uniref:Mce protein n=1 Tax=Mycobacterium sp. OTB74 TaxID=1853452 RepID=UPI0024759047|nr:Mce protein [Mycobacterium sp. OTB74]MDH6244669.1 Mce-associated membrane protein [Mycobacterium sp. OTB74]
MSDEPEHGRHSLDEADGGEPDAAAEATAGTEAADTAETEAEDLAEIEAEGPAEAAAAPVKEPRDKRVLAVMAAGLVVVLALGGLVGWLGYREYQMRSDETLRQSYLDAARQGALNLTTIDYRHVDADVKRVLDSSTGAFYDDFQRRAASFSDVVKQMQSAAVGKVTEAGVEKATVSEGSVLVAVTVHTDVGNGPPQPDRAWRIRLGMQKAGDSVKVSKVEFVQ